MNEVESVASDIAGSIKTKGYQINPIIIIGIIQIISYIIINCRPTNHRLKNPSFFDRIRLRMLVRKKLPKNMHKDEIYAAFLEKGQKISDFELTRLYNEL